MVVVGGGFSALRQIWMYVSRRNPLKIIKCTTVHWENDSLALWFRMYSTKYTLRWERNFPILLWAIFKYTVCMHANKQAHSYHYIGKREREWDREWKRYASWYGLSLNFEIFQTDNILIIKPSQMLLNAYANPSMWNVLTTFFW